MALDINDCEGKDIRQLSWQEIVDSPDDPVSFSDRVRFCQPSVLVGCPPVSSELEAEIGRLRTAIEAMIASLTANEMGMGAVDIGRAALEK